MYRYHFYSQKVSITWPFFVYSFWQRELEDGVDIVFRVGQVAVRCTHSICNKKVHCQEQFFVGSSIRLTRAPWKIDCSTKSTIQRVVGHSKTMLTRFLGFLHPFSSLTSLYHKDTVRIRLSVMHYCISLLHYFLESSNGVMHYCKNLENNAH